jgi:hypothetical protein
MFEWIFENAATVIISAVLAAAVIGITVGLIKNKKRGKSSCGCGCEGCAIKDICSGKK